MLTQNLIVYCLTKGVSLVMDTGDEKQLEIYLMQLKLEFREIKKQKHLTNVSCEVYN